MQYKARGSKIQPCLFSFYQQAQYQSAITYIDLFTNANKKTP